MTNPRTDDRPKGMIPQLDAASLAIGAALVGAGVLLALMGNVRTRERRDDRAR